MMKTNFPSCLFARQLRIKQSHRMGALLLELIVSTGMLMAILLAVSKMSVAQNRHQRTVEREIVATHQLQNLMETYLAKDWDTITNEVAHGLKLPESAQQYFPNHEINVVIKESADEQREKHVVIDLSWRGNQGATQRRKSLACWIYDQSEAVQ